MFWRNSLKYLLEKNNIIYKQNVYIAEQKDNYLGYNIDIKINKA